MRSFSGFIFAVVVLAGGCKTQPGENCSADSDCGSGAKCIGVGNVVDGGCMIPSQKLCQNLCTNNTDCANTSGITGATHSCGSDCAGSRFCQPSF
jgi:hypothetical protein